jgi:uncharacterized membrane protein YiaA
MIAIALCLLAFVACYWAGRRSLGQGLVMLFFFGFFYGILRANLITVFSHFIFDAGMVGLLFSPKWRAVDPSEKKKSEAVVLWTAVLILWPVIILLLPFQPFLVSLVGLRGNTFFLPLLIMGSRLKGKDLIEFSTGLAVLDLVALGFAGAEYFLGVPRFFPVSPVTQIIYNSGDVAGGFFRIPATFSSAHAFGGTMVGTMPYLIGLWTTAQKPLLRTLALVTMPLALLGVLMSATRQNFVYGIAMLAFVIFTAKMNGKQRVFFFLIILVVAYSALSNVRFQRFKSLGDTEGVAERIAGSVNRSFFEILTEYPMGNGLGGGGTSLPYFLQSDVKNPIGMENEYARILCEQGVIGLLLWLGFVTWFFFHIPVAFRAGPWAATRRLVWCMAAIGLGTAWIGTGLLASIPGTVLLVMGMGWTVVPMARELSTASGRVGLAQARYRTGSLSAVR